MKDFKILKFLDLFKGFFEKMGVDYAVMRKILNVKLLLDGRRVSTVLVNHNSKKKKKEDDDKNNFVRSLGMYLIMGVFLIMFVVIGKNYLFQMTLTFSILMFLLMTSLIADFSSVLLDIKDSEILLSKPIDNRTLNTAKILHIFMYITMITSAIAGPSLIVSIFRHGFVFFAIYLIEIILVSLFVIILTALIYLLVLRFSSGEKLKDIINYVQIGLTITMSLGYQLIMRVFNFVDINNMEYKASMWKYFMPPIWFAGLFELIINKNYSDYIIIYSILAVVVPILSIILYIKSIPTFERNLQKLNSTEVETKDKNKITRLLSKILCKNKEERTFFRFSTSMLRNERTFKLKVYPSLGLAVIFPFFMMLSMNRREFLNVINTKNYLWIYMSFIMIPVVIESLGYSGNYKGAWVFETNPIEDKSAINSGTLKAAIVNLFVPVFILVSSLFLVIYRMQIVEQIIVAGINMLLFIIIIYKSVDEFIPFSKAFQVSESNVGGGTMFFILFLMGLFVGVHFITTLVPYGAYIYIALGLIVSKIAWKKIVI